MARRNHLNRPRTGDAVPSLNLAPPTFPLPRGEHAWQDWCTRRELRRRLYRCVRRLGWLVAGYVVALLGIGAAATYLSGDAADGVITPLVLAMLGTVPWVIADGFGLLAVVRMWSFLIRYPWRAYECRYVTIDEGVIGAVRLTVEDPDSQASRHLVFQANRRRETLRGMILPRVWIAGGARRGVLVMAGGGELFLFHRDRSRERALVRRARRAAQPPGPRRPVKPRKVRQLSPRQQAKAQERARARARSDAAARATRKQRKPVFPLRGQRLLGSERNGGGIFKKK